MYDELEVKIRRRAHELWECESHPDGLAERHWLEAEREIIEEAENAAVSRWAAPVSGTYIEKSNEAARIAGEVREASAAAHESAAEHQKQPITRAGDDI